LQRRVHLSEPELVTKDARLSAAILDEEFDGLPVLGRQCPQDFFLGSLNFGCQKRSPGSISPERPRFFSALAPLRGTVHPPRCSVALFEEEAFFPAALEALFGYYSIPCLVPFTLSSLFHESEIYAIRLS